MSGASRPQTRRLFQTVLLLVLAAAVIRVALIYRGRSEGNTPARTTTGAPPLNPDYYVNPRKLHAYDLNSARALTQQPVWIREGHKYTYYPLNPRTRHADFNHPAGTLGPLERLQIKDVILDRPPAAPLQPGEVRANPNQRQVMAVFAKDGKDYAFPFGVENRGDFQIYSDEIVYLQDPHGLYKHWPKDVWEAIDRHEVRPGMSELQASFALGMGVPQPGGSDARVLRYPNGGKPLEITFRDGKAVEIRPQPAG